MTVWLHSLILATSIAAGAAVGIAGASSNLISIGDVAAKADRLPVATIGHVAYRTVETRSDRISVLTRVPIAE